MTDFFTAEALAGWQRTLAASPAFRAAAAGWHGRLLLLEGSADAPTRRAWIVVADGTCPEARPGTPADAEVADFVLAASAATWRDLASARTTPITAAMTGRLQLVQGDLFALAPHAKAAAALLAAANGERRTENGEQRTEQ